MIGSLYKLNLTAIVSGMILRGSKKKAGPGRKVLFGFLFLYVAVALTFALGTMFSQLLEPFYAVGIGWMYFAVFAAVLFALDVLGTLFLASAQIFSAKDNESLLSLPIRPGHILISRILVLLTYEGVISLFVLIPGTFIWIRGGQATWAGILLLLLGFVLLQLLALSVSLLLAWLLSALGGKVRFKNLLTLFVSVAFLLAYFYVYANVQRYLGELVSHGEEIAAAFKQAMPPFYAFAVGVAEGDFLQFAVFALWALVPFALVCWLLSLRYLKLLTTKRGMAKVQYKEKNLQRSGLTVALIKKDLALYWSKSTIVLNTSLGSIFSLVAAVLLLVKRSDVLSFADGITHALPGITLPALAAAAIITVGTTNNLSASLISLEGSSLWSIKSLPIPPQKVILSKAYAHLLVSSLPCLLVSVVFSAILAETSLERAMIILVPQTFLFLMAVGGIVLNLMMPRLDWISEVQVVKQSAAAMFTMFGAMAVVAGLGILYFLVLKELVAMDAFLWICGGLFTAGSIFFLMFIRVKGPQLYMEL